VANPSTYSKFRFGTKIETHLLDRVGKELTPLHRLETRSGIAIVAFMLEGYPMDPAAKLSAYGDRKRKKERGFRPLRLES
jgi:hypothetical protein